MSWSISFVGDPEKVAQAIEKKVNELTGDSQEEYAMVYPHLAALVRQNFQSDPSVSKPGIMIEASGHGYKKDGQLKTYSTCAVKIRVAQGLIT